MNGMMRERKGSFEEEEEEVCGRNEAKRAAEGQQEDCEPT